MTIVDTDVLIDFLLDINPGAQSVRREIEAGSLCTTAVTRFEVLSGIRNRKQETSVAKLLKVLRTLPVDEAAADKAAQLRRDLEKKGLSIGMADSLIAGTVVLHGGRLLTRNRRHFGRVAGLMLADVF